MTAGETDLSLILESDDVGSLQVDTPILYRGINVGAVTAITLPDVDSRIRIDIAIRGDHASLVRTNSVFWRVIGIHTSLAGLDPTIDIASLATLVRGGISFATPEEPGDPASANAVFELLDAPPDAVEIELPQDGLKLVLTAERAGIAEFDGGLPRAEAETRAFECCVVEWLNRNPVCSPPGRCLDCGGS